MNQQWKKGLLSRGLSLVVVGALGFSTCVLNMNGVNLQAQVSNEEPKAPALPEAKEVDANRAEKKEVATAEAFVAAFLDYPTRHIVLTEDIDLTSVEAKIRGHSLNRSLQIDGNGKTLTTTEGGPINDRPTFNLSSFSHNRKETFHLKNIKIHTRGRKYIYHGEAVSPRSEGWQIILDDVEFNESKQGERALSVVEASRAHVFLRGTVNMTTTNDSLIAGQITVEPGAKVESKVKGGSSNLWFGHPNQGAKMVDKSINIGSKAEVTLNGSGQSAAIAGHWQTINVHPEATVRINRPGNAISSGRTDTVRKKEINVFTSAMIDAKSDTVALNEEAARDLETHLYAAAGSTVNFTGQVNLRNKNSSFILNEPKEYDLRIGGRNSKNGSAVSIGQGGAFKIIKSDIRVWSPSWGGSDLGGMPSSVWSNATLVTDGSGKAGAGTNDPNRTTPSLAASWQTNQYTRISGSNEKLTLKVDALTDAHKTGTVQVSIGGSPIQWEGQVKLAVIDESTGVDIASGFNAADSTFVYSSPNGGFFEAGKRYTIIAYRDTPTAPTAARMSVKVEHVTPPKPVTIIPVYSGDKTISGMNGLPGAKVSATYDGMDLALSGDLTVKYNGTWEFAVPNDIYLETGKEIQVFLTDKAGKTTPKVNETMYDATFEAATTITVEENRASVDLVLKDYIGYQKDKPVTDLEFMNDIIVQLDNRVKELKSNFADIVKFDTRGLYQVNVTWIDHDNKPQVKVVSVVIF